jgi:hypothetical protein
MLPLGVSTPPPDPRANGRDKVRITVWVTAETAKAVRVSRTQAEGAWLPRSQISISVDGFSPKLLRITLPAWLWAKACPDVIATDRVGAQIEADRLREATGKAELPGLRLVPMSFVKRRRTW